TEKEVRFFSEKRGVPVKKTEMTIDGIYRSLGKTAGILTVCGDGFAEKALSLCENLEVGNDEDRDINN
ncbi:MAG: hypothetical protein K2J73_12915, partial [Oscillospiraceae bacterium]|nr:hypothetical protein [Oscillospiraceae bacterium]